MRLSGYYVHGEQEQEMNVLLVYPDYPDTFWSFKHALRFVAKKSTEPPLGLLTVASMLPESWTLKLIDMKVARLKEKHLDWADMVMISAMSIQRESSKAVIKRCNESGVKVVCGGPLFSTGYEDFEGVDHFVLDEAELSLPEFLQDLEAGTTRHLYRANGHASLEDTPVPKWELVNLKNYATVNIQYSRGCPYNCEFCDITNLFGRKVRTKPTDRFLAELDRIHSAGWRGGVFIVDDNFIGNKVKLKKELLPAMIRWQHEHHMPFAFGTEASINLADDEELMVLMAMAGFNSVFVGIETVHEDSLEECNKKQNKNRDMAQSIRKMHDYGLQAKGGFIVGFDNDPPNVFERISTFIQETGIVTAMVGLLNAPKGTRLYNRLKSQNRLLNDATGDNTDSTINFIPTMDIAKLREGYQSILDSIYSIKPYYRRVKQFLREYKSFSKVRFHFRYHHLHALVGSIFRLGIFGRERGDFWKLLFWTLFHRPRLTAMAITFAVYGYHFRKVFNIG